MPNLGKKGLSILLAFPHYFCNTALTNALLIVGANTVGSTLWQIDDEITVRLMKRFYQGFTQDEDVDASLRAAQLQILQEEPSLRHPRYWAAFKIIGRFANPLQ